MRRTFSELTQCKATFSHYIDFLAIHQANARICKDRGWSRVSRSLFSVSVESAPHSSIRGWSIEPPIPEWDMNSRMRHEFAGLCHYEERSNPGCFVPRSDIGPPCHCERPPSCHCERHTLMSLRALFAKQSGCFVPRSDIAAGGGSPRQFVVPIRGWFYFPNCFCKSNSACCGTWISPWVERSRSTTIRNTAVRISAMISIAAMLRLPE